MNRHLYLLIILLVSVTACQKSLVISDVDYSHSIESVLRPSEMGNITDTRHGLSFNIRSLEFEEFQDSTNHVDEVRMIRDKEGYYYLTASRFKHVYIFKASRGELKLHKKLPIEEELSIPVFNKRSPFIELVDLDNEKIYYINYKGLQTGGKS